MTKTLLPKKSMFNSIGLNLTKLFFFLFVHVVFSQQQKDLLGSLKLYDEASLNRDKGLIGSHDGFVANFNKSSTAKSGDFSTFTVTSVDLNGPTAGNNHFVLVNQISVLFPTVAPGITITSSSGTVTSARLTFSTSPTGTPAGVQNANEVVRFLASNGTTTVNTYFINTTSATVSNTVYGSNNFRITHNVSAGVFDITDQGGLPIQVANLQALLRNTLYGHAGGTVTEGLRYMVVSVTDPDNTQTAYTEIQLTRPPVAVDDVNSVQADAVAAVTGNILANSLAGSLSTPTDSCTRHPMFGSCWS